MSAHYSTQAAESAVASGTDGRYAVMLARGTLELGYYMPRGTDPQQPHRQDEIYVVTSGAGYFICNGDRKPFRQGDALFVPAGAEHRFEDFTDDFAAWVVFYGVAGGEADGTTHHD